MSSSVQAGSAAKEKGHRWGKKGVSPRKPGARRVTPSKTLGDVLSSYGAGAGGAAVPEPLALRGLRSRSGAKRGRWASSAAVGTEARGGGGSPHRARLGLWNPELGLHPPGAWPSSPAPLGSQPHLRRPQSPRAVLPLQPQCPHPRRVSVVCRGGRGGRGGCVHRSAAVGGSAAGFPAEKRPHPSPGLFETLNRNRRQEAPGRPGSGPSPDFPPGWGRNDSPPSPFPRFPCLHFSSRPRGGPCSGPQPLARHPRRRGPGSQSKAAPARRGFSGPGLPPARHPGLGTPPPAHARPLPYCKAWRVLPALPVRPGKGRGRAAQGV